MNLYEVFTNRERIIKSVGEEYSNLDYDSLLILLISNMTLFNMLDSESTTIASDPKFWTLLSSVKYDNKYKGMYFLDVILLSLNTPEARSLIQSHGSNKAKDGIYNPIFSQEVLNNILSRQTDLDTIINMYNTSRDFRSILDNPKFLQQIMLNIYYKLEPLHMSYLKYYSENTVIKGDITKSEIPSLNFKAFTKWYINNYYTRYCDRDMLICYAGARSANDKEGISKNYSMILDHIYWYKDDSIEYIPPRYLLELINATNVDEDERYEIITSSIYNYAQVSRLIDEDIEAYTEMVSMIEEDVDDEQDLSELMMTPINDVRLFKVVYDTLIKGREDDIDILKNVENTVDSINRSVRNSFIQYEFIKCIEYTLGEQYVYEVIKDDWENTLMNDIGNSTNGNITLLYEDELIQQHVVEMLNELKRYVNNDRLKDIIIDMARNLDTDSYSIIINILEEYIS